MELKRLLWSWLGVDAAVVKGLLALKTTLGEIDDEVGLRARRTGSPT